MIAALAPFTPEAVAAATGHRRRRHPSRRPRALRRAERQRLRPHRHHHHRVRHHGLVADRRGQHLHRQPRPPWRGDVPEARRGQRQHPRARAARARASRSAAGTPRCAQLPEVMGEYPAAAMAEEITDAGRRRIRALVTVAGNPVLSTPNSEQLDAAFAAARVHGERRHLPERDHPPRRRHPAAAVAAAARPLRPRRCCGSPCATSPTTASRCCRSTPGEPDEWEILARLGLIAAGLGPDADPAAADDLGAGRRWCSQSVGDPSSPIHGRDADEILAALGDDAGAGAHARLHAADRAVRRRVRCRTRTARASRCCRPTRTASTSAPLQPRLPEVLRTPSGTVELAHPVLMADLRRLRRGGRPARRQRELVLVGRRHLRSNNSWMHNIEVLVKGKPRCTLQVHPDDAAPPGSRRRGSGSGDQPRRARSTRRSRSPTRCGPGW